VLNDSPVCRSTKITPDGNQAYMITSPFLSGEHENESKRVENIKNILYFQ
jgi:hypothetical protein